MMKPENFFILSNSPGELAGWVQPVVAEIKRRCPGARLEIFLTPCQFQSGTEEAFASGLGVNKVWPAAETLRFCLKGFPGETRKNKGVVLLLGGDQFYGKKISRQLGWPLFVYTQTRIKYDRDTAAYFVPSEKLREKFIFENRRMAPEKLVTVGDLVVDAVTDNQDPATVKKQLGIAPDKLVVTFMPSSRLNIFRDLLPFYLEAARLVATRDDRIEFLFNISEFIPDDFLRSCLEGYQIEETSSSVWLIRRDGWTGRVVKNAVYDALKITDLLVTIPGTNTQQAAYLGIPMLVFLPLNRPEDLQFEGLLGLAGNLPLVGGLVKRLAMAGFSFYISRKKTFFALPNMAARKFVVSEIVGMISAKLIAGKIFEIIYDKVKLASISRELKIGASQKGAASRIVNYLLAASRSL